MTPVKRWSPLASRVWVRLFGWTKPWRQRHRLSASVSRVMWTVTEPLRSYSRASTGAAVDRRPARTRNPAVTAFAPGHDKRAEAKVIMEVFGGVPQFVTAFGYGPDEGGGGEAGTASWADAAMRLKGIPEGERQLLRLEYPAADGTGQLQRTRRDVYLAPVALEQGAATFTEHDHGIGAIHVPFVDVVAVYRGDGRWIVRIAGTFEKRGGIVEYVPLARDELGKVARATLRLMELAPLKKAAMEAWKRLGFDHIPALWVESASTTAPDLTKGFAPWREFEAAVASLSFDDRVLIQRCEALTAQLTAADSAWFHARQVLRAGGDNPTADMISWKFLQSQWNFGVGGKGEKLVEAAHDAYVQLLRHLDTLVR
jgi:hypothetical protein